MLSSSSFSANVTLNVLTGWDDTSDIRPTTALESIPPDRKAPYATSDRILSATASESKSRILCRRAGASKVGSPRASSAGSHHWASLNSSSCTKSMPPGSSMCTSATMVAGAWTVPYIHWSEMALVSILRGTLAEAINARISEANTNVP